MYLVDDHHVVREGLRVLLERDGRVHIAGEASSGEEALRELAHLPCDLVLMDLTLPGADGVACVGELARRRPDLPVLILSMHCDGKVVARALDAGARGYLPKTARAEDLHAAFAAVRDGGVYVHPSVVTGFMADREEPRIKLTPREREVLHRAARGLTAAQIGEALFLSETTVKTHLGSLYRKLEAANRSEMIFRAMSEGLLGDDDSGT